MKKRLWLLGVAVLLVASILGASWMFLGYWWNPFSPCSAPIDRLGRGAFEPAWLLPFGTDVIENQGRVCFYPSQYGNPPSNNLQVQVYSSGCYSSSCSLVYERTGQMKIDQAAFAIQISSRFAIKPLDSQRFGTKWACACTDDCGGAGLLEYETGTLLDGIYQVYLGNILIGSLTIPFTPNNLCLDTEHAVQGEAASSTTYPPPTNLSTPVFAYPAPVSTSSVPATPYPEPGASLPATLAPTAANPTAVAVRNEPVWYSPVITVALPISLTEAIVTGEWISSTRLHVETWGTQSSGSFWVDLDTVNTAVSTLQPTSSSNLAYSASSVYSVRCSNPLQLVSATNGTIISQSDLLLNANAASDCKSFVLWLGDSAAGFGAQNAAGERGTYLWQSDGSQPKLIGPRSVSSYALARSPDSQYLGLVYTTGDEPYAAQMVLFDPSGQIVQSFPVTLPTYDVVLEWFTPVVIVLRGHNASWRYYDVANGELLFEWQHYSMGSIIHYLPPRLSPNQRWVILERGILDTNGVEIKTYSLYDVQNRQEMLLYDRPWHGLEFSGWSPDGETLYVLHIPLGPDAVPDVDLPYGLLAYHLAEGRFETLVENAQSVSWDAGYQRALVYIFVQNNAGQATLSAGIWETDRKQVTGAYPVTNPPTQYDFLLHPAYLDRFVPATWSPDGQQVALFTWGGELIFMDLDGQTQRLASQVGLGRSDFTRLLAWSPDGSRLFVSDRGTAWVVTVPAVGHWREMRYERSDWSINLWNELFGMYETALHHRVIPGCILAPAYGHGLQGTDLTVIHERSETPGSMLNYTTIVDSVGNPLYSNVAIGDEFISVKYPLERKVDCIREAEKVFLAYRDDDLTPPAWSSSYAYDRAHSQLLAFGGYREGNYLPVAQTWAYDTQGWRQLQPSAAPSERSEAGLAYDHSAQVMVLFGGQQLQDLGNGLAGNSLQDTWIWNGVNWVEQHPTNSPPARGGALMVYDEVRQVILLFGGISLEGEGGRDLHFLSDTWVWDGKNWSQQDSGELSNGAIPQPSMVYDVARQNVVLWQYTTGTWIWDGQRWDRQSPQHSPNLFSEGVLGYDEERQQVVFWGFHDTEGGRLVTTYVWNGQDWSKVITDSPGPDTVMASTKLMVYDTFQKTLNLIITTGDKFTSRLTIWTWTGSGWEVKH